MSKAKMPILWTVALYVAAASAVYFSISGVVATGAWLPILMLAPLMVLLLPPLRGKVDPRDRYLPGPIWTLGAAVVLVFFQAYLFGSHASDTEKAKEAKRQQESKDRVAKIQSDLVGEYERDKLRILAQIESLLSSNQPKEALATANKYFVFNKDPDLARLQSRAELDVMKLELQNEAALPLARREQIYKTLIREVPGSLAQYQGKLAEVTAALDAERKAKAMEAKQAALKASIQGQFSGFDGSHRKVEAALKERMKNPSSYEHVKTTYSVGVDAIVVVTTYRGTNGFGGVVTNQAIATVDKDGNVLTLSAL